MKSLTSCRLFAFCFCLLAGRLVHASTPESSPVWDGIRSSFALPWRDLLVKQHESTLRSLAEGFSVNLSYSHALTETRSSIGKGTQGAAATNDSLQLGVKYNPLSYWFVSLNTLAYLHRDLQKPWDPDFSYVFGYDDWHPYTLSLTYANYGGNRIHPNTALGEHHTRFNQGAWTLGWKFPLPEPLQHLVTVGHGDAVNCSTALTWIPEYTDLASNSVKPNKETVSLGCKYSLTDAWYFNGNAVGYPHRQQQQPWDPDFTYGFGYFDWHPGSISVQYNNYSGNRFPGRLHAAGTGTFRNGAISVSWGQSW